MSAYVFDKHVCDDCPGALMGDCGECDVAWGVADDCDGDDFESVTDCNQLKEVSND